MDCTFFGIQVESSTSISSCSSSARHLLSRRCSPRGQWNYGSSPCQAPRSVLGETKRVIDALEEIITLNGGLLCQLILFQPMQSSVLQPRSSPVSTFESILGSPRSECYHNEIMIRNRSWPQSALLDLPSVPNSLPPVPCDQSHSAPSGPPRW